MYASSVSSAPVLGKLKMLFEAMAFSIRPPNVYTQLILVKSRLGLL